MTADPVLTLAWLVLAHLVADFALQTGPMVAAKGSSGMRAVRGLLAHGLAVAVCLVPFVFAFGLPGLWLLVAIAASHVVIDRLKVVATRRAEAGALAIAHQQHERRHAAASLGRAWTPVPAALFALDQAAHLVVIVLAWAAWLSTATLNAGWVDVVNGLLGTWDRAVVNEVTLIGVVLAALLIANIRGGALFVATLVRPLEAVAGRDEPPDDAAHPSTPPPMPDAEPPAPAVRRGWRLRLGPIDGSLQPIEPPAAETGPPEDQDVPSAPPSQVGATIGILERLLIVALLLTGAEAAIGLVIAAKTLARFRLLDDRDFAEYYLLGTLASVSVAVGTALLAEAALASLG